MSRVLRFVTTSDINKWLIQLLKGEINSYYAAGLKFGEEWPTRVSKLHLWQNAGFQKRPHLLNLTGIIKYERGALWV